MPIKSNEKSGYGFYADGTWKIPTQGATFENYDPATGQRISEISDCDLADTREAILSAKNAFPEWSDKTPKERAVYLRAIADKMISEADHLARTITEENGKPLKEAMGEVLFAADFFTWFSEECKRAYGEIIPSNAKGKWHFVLKHPIGVVGLITPWNFPLAMLARKLAPALGAGCTAIVKPAEQTPNSAIELFKIIESVGLPKGVANLVCTSNPATVGREFCINPDIRMISFTGSGEVGKWIIENSANSVTKLAMEHGGNAAWVVYGDADPDVAVAQLMASKFRNAGQTCICANRVYVHESIEKQFIENLEKAVSALVVGNGFDEGVDIGPIIDASGLEKVEYLVAQAVEAGAKCLVGGKRIPSGQVSPSPFFAPTLLTNCHSSMKIFTEETFGPVVPVSVFSDNEKVIRDVNNTPYGLSAYACTRSLKNALDFAKRVEAGVIGINDGLPSTPECPFGGFKESGIGREGGWRGLDEFMEVKYVSLAP